MHEVPININERRIHNLRLTKARLLASIAEVDMEIQRIELGMKPKGLAPIDLSPRLPKLLNEPIPRPYQEPSDTFWRRQVEFQASQQSDNKL